MSDLDKTTYLPEEMAEEIQGLKKYIGSGGGGSNLDAIQFGALSEDELYATLTNPGSTDPKHYEEIAEAINELHAGIDFRDYDIFIEKTITQNGEYVAFDDDAYGYSVVLVDVAGSEGSPSKKRLIERTIEDISDDNIEIIGSYAFGGCFAVSRASFPNCSMIGSYAFTECSALSSISFPNCLSVGSYAFFNCGALETAVLPRCLSIFESAFQNCSLLSSVSLPMCIEIESNTFYKCSALTAVDLPACQTISGPSAFAHCILLSEVSLPFIEDVPNSTFRSCLSLKKISFPFCSTIGNYAFANCISLSEAYLPSCASIGSSAFYGCTNLISLYLLWPSVCQLQNSHVFESTPMSTYYSSINRYGSIFVPAFLWSAYCNHSYWKYYSQRIVAYQTEWFKAVVNTMNRLVLTGDIVSMSETTLYLPGSKVSFSSYALVL